MSSLRTCACMLEWRDGGGNRGPVLRRARLTMTFACQAHPAAERPVFQFSHPSLRHSKHTHHSVLTDHSNLQRSRDLVEEIGWRRTCRHEQARRNEHVLHGKTPRQTWWLHHTAFHGDTFRWHHVLAGRGERTTTPADFIPREGKTRTGGCLSNTPVGLAMLARLT